MCFHAQLGWAKGGFLCVSVFFTLSGFLITSLVLGERSRTGRVAVTAFWARRARRLLPASIAALLLALFVTAVAVPAAQQVSVVGDIRSALFQFANWRFISQGAKYADLTSVPSPVQHYWSLTIEEQFYIVFPLIAAVALRRRTAVIAGIFTGVVALSVWQQLHLDGVERIYYGTDARAAEIAVGGLLALAYPRLRSMAVLHRWRIPDIAGMVGLAAALVLFFGVPQQRPAIFNGGLAAFSVVSAMMVLGAVEGPIAQRVFGFRPLVELGKISYGVYLYHFPLYIVLDQERVGFGGVPLLAVRAAAAISLGWVSYRWYERPIRIGAAIKGRMIPIAVSGAAAAVLLAGIPVARHGSDREQLVFEPVAPAESTSSTSTSSMSGTAPTVTGTSGPLGTTPSSTVTLAPTTTTIAPARPPRIVVVGDSTAAANGAGLEAWGKSTGRLQVVTVSEPGCAVVPGVRFTIREGYVFEPARCDQVFPKAAATAESLDADAIVVFIGSSQLADWEYSDMEGLHRLGEPAIDSRYSSSMSKALSTIAGSGRPVLWATVPLPVWDLTVFSQNTGAPVPGQGPITLNDPPRTVRINALNGSVVPGTSLATLWPFAARLTSADGTVPKRIRPDGLHLSNAGVAEVADAWLFDELGAAFRSVVARAPSGLRPVGRQSWSAPGAPLG